MGHYFLDTQYHDVHEGFKYLQSNGQSIFLLHQKNWLWKSLQIYWEKKTKQKTRKNEYFYRFSPISSLFFLSPFFLQILWWRIAPLPPPLSPWIRPCSYLCRKLYLTYGFIIMRMKLERCHRSMSKHLCPWCQLESWNLHKMVNSEHVTHTLRKMGIFEEEKSDLCLLSI